MRAQKLDNDRIPLLRNVTHDADLITAENKKTEPNILSNLGEAALPLLTDPAPLFPLFIDAADACFGT